MAIRRKQPHHESQPDSMATAIDEADFDFESALVLPQGPLSLRLRLAASKSSRAALPRPQTSHSEISASTSTSGSAIFSTSSSVASSADDFDDLRASSTSPLSAHSSPRRARARRKSCNSSFVGNDDSGQADYAEEEEEDNDDEKSNTIKANQLPQDFAAQLALSKAQAAQAKAAPTTDDKSDASASSQIGRVTHLGSNMSAAQSACDWDEDLDLDGPKMRLGASRLLKSKPFFASHISDSGAEEEGASGHSAHSASSKGKSSAITVQTRAQLAARTHARSSTFDSQGTSSDLKTDLSEIGQDDQDDFFDDLVLPAYFAVRDTGRLSRTDFSSPPTSVDSDLCKKADLQTILGEKMKARAALSEPQSGTLVLQSSNERNPKFPAANAQREQKPVGTAKFFKYRDQTEDSPFEDAFVLPDSSSRLAAAPSAGSGGLARPPLPNMPHSWTARSLQTKFPGASVTHRDKLSSQLDTPGNGLSARSSSNRSSTTLRPSRSSLNLALDRPRPMMSPSPSLQSLDGVVAATSAATTTARLPSLRARLSTSKLAQAAKQDSLQRPSGLDRKKSMPSLLEFSHPPAGDHSSMLSTSHRAPTSSAHYAQPTRSFLARKHHLAQGSEELGSRPASPAMAPSVDTTFVPRSGTPLSSASLSSPAADSATFARLMQPTIASRAKIRAAGSSSDPSGRSSASLGIPLSIGVQTLSEASTLNRRMLLSPAVASAASRSSVFKQPKRFESFGDGSELDGFDDLPVNRDSEKRFVKAPRRRQSSGAGSTVSTASAPAPASRRALPLAIQPSQLSGRRQRMDSAPDLARPGSTKPAVPALAPVRSPTRQGRSDSASTAASGIVAKTGTLAATHQLKGATNRPHLKLIRNLSAAGLAKVQGQMKWNPSTMKWEGNEASLRDFDNVIASSARPALISPIYSVMSPRHALERSPSAEGSSRKASPAYDAPAVARSEGQQAHSTVKSSGTTSSFGGVRVVGDMIFDPVKMCWFNTGSEGEEELDFGDEADIKDSKGGEVDAWEGGEQMRLRTRRSFAHDWSSNASSQGDGEDDFSFAAFRAKQQAAAKRHEMEMEKYGPPKYSVHNARIRVLEHRYLHDILKALQ